MSIENEISKQVRDILYNKLGDVIYRFEDNRKALIAKALEESPTAEVKKYFLMMYDEAFQTALPIEGHEEFGQALVFVHAVFIDDGEILPVAYYNFEPDEQTLITKKKTYPEVATDGHYKFWRFASEKWQDIPSP